MVVVEAGPGSRGGTVVVTEEASLADKVGSAAEVTSLAESDEQAVSVRVTASISARTGGERRSIT